MHRNGRPIAFTSGRTLGSGLHNCIIIKLAASPDTPDTWIVISFRRGENRLGPLRHRTRLHLGNQPTQRGSVQKLQWLAAREALGLLGKFAADCDDSSRGLFMHHHAV